jgi:hypothetical protein
MFVEAAEKAVQNVNKCGPRNSAGAFEDTSRTKADDVRPFGRRE